MWIITWPEVQCSSPVLTASWSCFSADSCSTLSPNGCTITNSILHERLFLLSVMYAADPQLPLLYYLTNNCKMGLLTIHRGESVGPWFMQMIRKTSRMGNSVRVQHVHLCNSLQFTESLELVWLLVQDLELVEKRKWNTTFRLEILSGNFGLPSKKIPFLLKFFYLGDGN